MDIRKKTAGKGRIGQRFSVFLLFLGTVWLAYILIGYVDSFSDVLPDSWASFLASLLLLSLSMVMPGFVFYRLLDEYHTGSNFWATSFNLYFAGQLLKYIPGKIWGIVYQVSHSDEISAWSITRVNVDQTIFSLLINVIFAVFILGVKEVMPTLLAFILVSMGIVTAFIYMLGGSHNVLRVVCKFSPRITIEDIEVKCGKSLSWKAVLELAIIQLVSVALFAASWHILANGYFGLKELDFVVLGMIYVIASAIGIVTMVTPAGLGVREASFVTLASSLTSINELAFIAVVARIWLVFSELIACFLILLLVKTVSVSKNRDMNN